MRNSVKKTSALKRRRRYLSPTSVVVAMLVLAIATVTVASRQEFSNGQETKSAGDSLSGARSLKVALQGPEAKSEQDGLTAEEAARMAKGLSEVIDQSTEGLVEIQHADGSVSMNLDDRFQNVTVARVDQRGNLAQSCVDNPQVAGSFFRISPELIENQRRLARPAVKE